MPTTGRDTVLPDQVAGRSEAPRVHLLCGLVGAGKTTHARHLAAELPAVRFSLDEWMLRLYELPYDDPQYAVRVEGCTALIWETAMQVLALGHDVVLDGNQWSRKHRQTWRQRVEAAGYRPILHHIDVSVETAVEQVARRTATGVPGSHPIDEAGVRHHRTIFEPPDENEGIEIVTVRR
ncbi:ATP-binding protein [Actinopolymorpha sp. B11F2]|uniref:AAA family ATPase n=1 Tax=Actinopolymorpha sp. B11F2 TaxID=3160862 RepID=UPI0032E3A927